ncbi:hypothetical protein AcW2_005681 [Taiwanofungus camphoratus]|nr:hypothetical protein AcW2_005681 [Antrodia cinnamomea]
MFHHSSDSLALPDDSTYMNKDSNGPLYVQHRTLEIIQLTEVPAPPRAQFPSTITSSSSASSSYISSSSDPEEESVCSSYCSSDPEESVASSPDDTYTTRLMRVLTWRESFAKAMGTPLPFPQPLPAPPLKRKADVDHQDSDDEAASHSSKRSRSDPYRPQAPWRERRLSAHSCPACDSSFATRQSLQQHGRDSPLNDACRTAVEYDCEA